MQDKRIGFSDFTVSSRLATVRIQKDSKEDFSISLVCVDKESIFFLSALWLMKIKKKGASRQFIMQNIASV